MNLDQYPIIQPGLFMSHKEAVLEAEVPIQPNSANGLPMQ